MAEAVLFLGGVAVATVVGSPIGGYVFSNYITKQKSWTTFVIGTVGSAILIPMTAFFSLEAIASYEGQQNKQEQDTSNKKMGIQPEV